jgi:ABC-type lipoprotein release transport system permease subunit
MRGAQALLFGLSPTDLSAVVGAICLLASAGVVAAALPAWRAARVPPIEALRSE